MKIEERCPRCGGPVETKTFRKSIGLGSIDFPLAQFCPNPECSWYQDFTETEKAAAAPPEEAKKPPRVSRPLIFKQMAVGIAILVVAGLLIAVVSLYPKQPAPLQPAPTATPIPAATIVIPTTHIGTPAIIAVGINYQRGFLPKEPYPKKDGTIALKISDTIVWTNEGKVPVTLIGKDQNGEKLFDKLLDYGSRWQHVFNKSGTFKFTIPNFEITVVVT